MKIKVSRSRLKSDFLTKVEEISGQKIFACYQCGKCSAGCPLSDDMDILPNQIMRFLQFGQEEILESKTIWLCASCFTCVTRCPHGIDIAKVMEALRLILLRKNVDHIEPSKIDSDVLKRGPQQLTVCTMRKYTG